MSNATHIQRTVRHASWRALGLAALLVMLLPACRGTVSSKPPVHLNPNMDNVTRIEAQEPSDFWSDGRGMRPPIEGTVAVGELRADTHLYAGVLEDGTWAQTLPASIPLNNATLERGQERFGIYCTPCHGEAGVQNGGVVPRRAGSWLVSSLHSDRARDYAIGEIYDVIKNGFNTMPAYAAQIPVEDRWAIATYVRALQVSNEMQLADVPTEIRSAQGWR